VARGKLLVACRQLGVSCGGFWEGSRRELPQGFADSALRYTLVYARQD